MPGHGAVLLLLLGEEEDDEDELAAAGAEDADEEPAAATGGAPHGTSQGSAKIVTNKYFVDLIFPATDYFVFQVGDFLLIRTATTIF